MKKQIKKILKITIFVIFTLINTCQAIEPLRTNLKIGGQCKDLLTYKGEKIELSYVYYQSKAFNVPAYCIDITKQGVTKEYLYDVTKKEYIKDDTLWRYIINGFPYKTVEELGCQTEKEAYMATQQAIYTYLYNYDINDFGAIGEAGERTLNALKQIIKNAKSSTEKRPSSSVIIRSLQEGFTIDEVDSNYVSKTYEIIVDCTIKKCTVMNLSDDKTIKITDENNVEKSLFKQNEKFKILVPVENLQKDGIAKFVVNLEIASKPIIEGVPDNPVYQNYALTAPVVEYIRIPYETKIEEPKEEPVIEEEPPVTPIIPEKKLPKTGM